MDLFKDNDIVGKISCGQLGENTGMQPLEHCTALKGSPVVTWAHLWPALLFAIQEKIDLLLHDLLTYWPERQTWHRGVTLAVLALCSPAEVGQSACLGCEHPAQCPLICTY